IIKKGNDMTLIACGETVYPALSAAKSLEENNGIQAQVVSMHIIKPLDTQLLKEIGSKGKPVVIVEEHMVNGGLGEACASYFMQNVYSNPFKIMGIPDEYTVTGSQVDIFNHYIISKDGIYKVCR